MKYSAIPFLAAALLAAPAFATTFQTEGASPAAWTKILGSVGIQRATSDPTIVVAGSSAKSGSAALTAAHMLILEGDSAAARSLGIVLQKDKVTVRQMVDSHAPKMQIIWEQPAEIFKAQLPEGFTVYAAERWQGAPLLAGKQTCLLYTSPSPRD